MTPELADIGKEVAVAERDSFGLAGRAGGKEEDRFFVALCFTDAQNFYENRGGEEF